MQAAGRPRVQRRLPVVLSKQEVVTVLRGLDGEYWAVRARPFETGQRHIDRLRRPRLGAWTPVRDWCTIPRMAWQGHVCGSLPES